MNRSLSHPVPNPVRITVHVKPLKSETKFLCDPDGTLTMHVTAPPRKGKANREIVKWISKRLGISSSNVQLVAGALSSVKVIEIRGMAYAEIIAALTSSKTDSEQ